MLHYNTFWDIYCHNNQPVCEAHAIVITDSEIFTLITKSTEPCTKGKLGYFSKIDVDIDCLNRIEKFQILLEAHEPCFWIIYKILICLNQIFQKKNQTFGGTLFWLTLYCTCRGDYISLYLLLYLSRRYLLVYLLRRYHWLYLSKRYCAKYQTTNIYHKCDEMHVNLHKYIYMNTSAITFN